MKKIKNLIALIALLLCGQSSWALNELVMKMDPAFKEGDLYTAFLYIPEIRKNIDENGNMIFTEMDEAFCNYYEAVNAQFLYNDIADKEKKLAHNTQHLGADHFTTLAMKAVYSKMQPDWVDNARQAMDAAEAEFGQDSWQYLAARYGYVESLSENGKFEEGLKAASGASALIKGTEMEGGWMDGLFNIAQATIFTNLQNADEAANYFIVATDIFNRRNNMIGDEKLTGLAMSGQFHLGHYITSILRAFGMNTDAISMTEELLSQMKQMDMDKTGLAMEMKGNISIAYFKEKDFAKSRPAMQEYLQYLEGKGEKDSRSYQYMESLYNQIPK